MELGVMVTGPGDVFPLCRLEVGVWDEGLRGDEFSAFRLAAMANNQFLLSGSYSLCRPLQSLLHKIPKEEAALHSLLKCKDRQEKEALRHLRHLLQPCWVW